MLPMTTFFIGDLCKETSVYWGLMEHKLSYKCLCKEENFVYLAKLITVSGKSRGPCFYAVQMLVCCCSFGTAFCWFYVV